MTDSALDRDPPVRVRFCPSPTGSPHVGLARTALFNWAFARHHGGTFVFRIEDTDAARDTEESYDTLLEVDALARLRLGRGPRGRRPATAPYRQSERVRPLRATSPSGCVDAGRTYHCYCTTEEVEDAQRKAAAPRAARRGTTATAAS